jgi:hypothetical protein
MQDDLQDLMDESGEVQELLARSYMTPDCIDEADLDAGKIKGLPAEKLNFFRIGCIGIRTNV